MRAYLATIAFLSVMKPDFLSLETAVEVSDFIFEAINSRPDGRRPTLMCLTACYLSMFSSFAKEFQNEGVKLEIWFKTKSKWEYLWKESITNWDTTMDSDKPKGSIENQGYTIPSDIVAMVHNNDTMVKNMQSSFDRGMSSLSQASPSTQFSWPTGQVDQGFKKQKGGGRGGGGKGGKGKGGQKVAPKGSGKLDSGDVGAKRQVSANAGFKAWRKMSKTGGGGN